MLALWNRMPASYLLRTLVIYPVIIGTCFAAAVLALIFVVGLSAPAPAAPHESFPDTFKGLGLVFAGGYCLSAVLGAAAAILDTANDPPPALKRTMPFTAAGLKIVKSLGLAGILVMFPIAALCLLLDLPRLVARRLLRGLYAQDIRALEANIARLCAENGRVIEEAHLLRTENNRLAASVESLRAQLAQKESLRLTESEAQACVRRLRGKLHWDKVGDYGSLADQLRRAKALFNDAMTIINNRAA